MINFEARCTSLKYGVNLLLLILYFCIETKINVFCSSVNSFVPKRSKFMVIFTGMFHLASKLIISYHFPSLVYIINISHNFILLYQIIIFPGQGSCVHIARYVHVALCGLSMLFIKYIYNY
jgi:hypothetical protein